MNYCFWCGAEYALGDPMLCKECLADKHDQELQKFVEERLEEQKKQEGRDMLYMLCM